MKNIKKISVLVMILMMLCACVTKTEEIKTDRYKGKNIEEIVDSLTIEQKAAQMVQPQIASVSVEQMKEKA